jgi:hypothetical protein
MIKAIIQSRPCENDIADEVLISDKSIDCEKLCLPMKYEESELNEGKVWNDPRELDNQENWLENWLLSQQQIEE